MKSQRNMLMLSGPFQTGWGSMIDSWALLEVGWTSRNSTTQSLLCRRTNGLHLPLLHISIHPFTHIHGVKVTRTLGATWQYFLSMVKKKSGNGKNNQKRLQWHRWWYIHFWITSNKVKKQLVVSTASAVRSPRQARHFVADVGGLQPSFCNYLWGLATKSRRWCSH